MKPHIYNFDTWSAFVDYAENRTLASAHEQSRTDRGSWNGGDSWTDALTFARQGWPEGTAQVKTLSNALVDRVACLIEQPYLQYDVVGNDYDLGLYLAGVPEHWYRQETELQQGSGKVIRIVFNCSVAGDVRSEVMKARGATVAALVECLELTGNKVEVVFTATANWGTKGIPLHVEVPLKHAGQPLDIDRLAFALVHPASLRRLVFSVMESNGPYMAKYSSTYGKPSDKPDGDVYIGSALADAVQWSSPDKATAWIIAELQKQGVTIQG